MGRECHDAQILVVSDPDLIISMYERRMLMDLVIDDYTGVKDSMESIHPHLKNVFKQ